MKRFLVAILVTLFVGFSWASEFKTSVNSLTPENEEILVYAETIDVDFSDTTAYRKALVEEYKSMGVRGLDWEDKLSFNSPLYKIMREAYTEGYNSVFIVQCFVDDNCANSYVLVTDGKTVVGMLFDSAATEILLEDE